ncbi:MAG: shikimate dehydrogenase [Acidobacteriaceae bacterium]|nr:shikimate dehydrogenase [Acidobacteriaceae bacterium]
MPSLPSSHPRVCVALGFASVDELMAAAEHEFKDGNKFLEFRLDYLGRPATGIEAIRRLVKKYSDLQILATCRARSNGGHFKGSLDAQIAVLTDAAGAGAFLIDLEIESAGRAKDKVAMLRSKRPLIVSYHNFTNTPALEPILRRLQRVPADAYKIVTTARKPNDQLRLSRFLSEHSGKTPLVAFCMSEAGLASRILSPSLGCIYTYASPAANEGTAPGQISARQMRSLYRCDKLTRHSRLYGIIADPVSHTKSPVIHNRAFQARRLDAVYLPFLVPSNYLGEWMKVASGMGMCGFSVTIPHKQRILRYLDVVEPLAKRIGAVNTVWRRGGKWRGTNTDAEGVMEPLSRHLRLPHASVLVAGYGGGARAAAIALSDAGARITVTGRDLRSAAALARAAKGESVSLAEAERQHFDALIHATPVGMFPHADRTLFSNRIPARVVLDMVYNPRETVLLAHARQQGCTPIYGSEMLLAQAARQFEIWTGESAPRSVMQTALETLAD